METRRGSMRARTTAIAGLALSSLYGGCTLEPTLTPEHTRVHTIQTDVSQLPPLPFLDTFTEFDNVIKPLHTEPNREAQQAIQDKILLVKIESASHAYGCAGFPVAGGTIATAAHCIEGIAPDELRVSVMTTNGDLLPVQHITTVEGIDISLLSLNMPADSTPLATRPTAELAIGDRLFIHAKRTSKNGDESRTFTGRYLGIADNLDVKIDDKQLENYFLVTANADTRIDGGFSGSAITDESGKVVGILIGSSFSRIKVNGKLFRAGLGVRIEPIEPAIKRLGK